MRSIRALTSAAAMLVFLGPARTLRAQSADVDEVFTLAKAYDLLLDDDDDDDEDEDEDE